jgi:hypothetical protein
LAEYIVCMSRIEGSTIKMFSRNQFPVF